MDYQKIIKVSNDKLKTKFPEIVQDIKNCVLAGSTGSEIIFILGKYIKNLESINIEAYHLIKLEIVDYLNECKKNGIKIQ